MCPSYFRRPLAHSSLAKNYQKLHNNIRLPSPVVVYSFDIGMILPGLGFGDRMAVLTEADYEVRLLCHM